MLSARMALPAGVRKKPASQPSWGRQRLPLWSGSIASYLTRFDSANWGLVGCEIFETPPNKGEQGPSVYRQGEEVQRGERFVQLVLPSAQGIAETLRIQSAESGSLGEREGWSGEVWSCSRECVAHEAVTFSSAGIDGSVSSTGSYGPTVCWVYGRR